MYNAMCVYVNGGSPLSSRLAALYILDKRGIEQNAE